MNDNEGFLAAILANPDDDQLRLIYADWLEERGDPRGEFIRVQIELAGENLEPRRAHELVLREKELLATHETEWVRPLGSLLRGWTFRRGFLEEVEMDCSKFLAQAPALVQAAPVRGLRVHSVRHLVADFAQCPYLARLHELSFPGGGPAALSEHGLAILAQSPYLTSLKSLMLPSFAVDAHGIREIAWSPTFAGLASLNLQANEIGDLGLHWILASTNFTKLRCLVLANCGISNSGITALARSPLIGQLETLALGYNKIDNRGVRAFADCRRLDSLRNLSLKYCSGLNGLAIRSLAQCRRLAGLTELDLSHNNVGDSGAEALADSPHLHNLSCLNLSKSHGITPAGKDRLQKRFGSRVML